MDNINYRDWEALEDEAYEDSVSTKKKPKKKKKSWKEINSNETSNKRNKKNGKLWSNNPDRI